MRVAAACLLAIIPGALGIQGQQTPADLYQRTREHVKEQIQRLPRYTCVQTITRHVYRNPSSKTSNCERILRNRDGMKPMTVQWDRLRVDVAIADKQEVYSWVGASRFEETDLSKLVGGGQTTMGDFGSLVLSVFENHPGMHFAGERKEGTRRLLEFTYDTPEKLSRYEVRVSFEKFVTAYSGSVFLDAETGDLVRVTASSAVLPPQTGYCQVTKQLNYTRLRVGAVDALIPSQASSTAIDMDQVEMSSTSDYSACREYVGESVLRFDDLPATDSTDGPAASVSTAAPSEIPPGLPFECRIVSTIDSDTAAGGDPIQGVLRTPIANASGKVIAPAGTLVHGRLINFIQHPSTVGHKESYEVVVQLRSLDFNGQRVPFAANVVNATPDSRGQHGPIRLSLRKGAGTFIFYDKKLHAANVDAKWVTVPRITEATIPP
jgi:hypothetical protein